MKRIDALRELEAAVVAGTIDANTPHCDIPGMQLLGAYRGSTNAAKKLQFSVLTGWTYTEIRSRANYKSWHAHIERVRNGEIDFVHANNKDLARAWLITIIRALIVEEEEK